MGFVTVWYEEYETNCVLWDECFPGWLWKSTGNLGAESRVSGVMVRQV